MSTAGLSVVIDAAMLHVLVFVQSLSGGGCCGFRALGLDALSQKQMAAARHEETSWVKSRLSAS